MKFGSFMNIFIDFLEGQERWAANISNMDLLYMSKIQTVKILTVLPSHSGDATALSTGQIPCGFAL